MSFIEQLRASRKTQAARLDVLTKKAEEGSTVKGEDGQADTLTLALTEAEEKEMDRLISSVQALDTSIDRLAAAETIQAAGRASSGRQTEALKPGDVRVGMERAGMDPMAGYRSYIQFALDLRQASRSGSTPSDRFVESQRLTEMYDATDAGAHPDAAPADFHREGIGSEAGFLVIPEMRNEVWMLFRSFDGIINRITMEPTGSNAVEFNKDESTPWGAGGVQAKWRDEGTQMTATKGVLSRAMNKLHELYAFVEATDEAMEDAPRLQSRLTMLAARALNWKASEALVYGTGAGQPLGWFNSGALVSVAKDSGQTADTFTVTNATNMLIRLLQEGGSAGKAFWLMNQDVLGELIIMVIGQRAIWTPPNEGLKDAPGGFLLGKPIVLSEQAKTLGDKGDVQLISPDGYFGLQKTGGVRFAESMHLFFDYGIMAFRWTFRMGGQPFLSAPVTPNNGTATRSHFVTVDARA